MNKSLLENSQQGLFAQVNSTSLDITDERITALKQLFPAIVTDGKINWGTLKAMLGESLEKESERYKFTWNGKSAAIMEAQEVSSKTLIPDIESSKNWDTTENLYIEGDNLETLKLLQNSYNGKIKMIYIDPPYNTGNDFIYEDDFVLSKEEMEVNEEIKDKKGTIRTLDRLQKNDRGSAKYHTNWLNMMYPRLSLARDLLTEDGVIFISIDDNEVHNLRKICDEMFGENNFVSEFVWKSKLGKVGTTSTIATTHEYIICYAKSFEKISFKMIEKENDGRKENLRQWGQADRREDRPSMFYPITIDGIEVYPIKEDGTDGRWRVGKEMAEELLEKGLLELVRKDNSFNIYRKFEAGISITPHDTLLIDKIGTTAKGALALKELNMNKVFDYSKPIDLIKFFAYLCTTNLDIILDFFSGSATTAHAITQLNAEDGGNRKYIMVQLSEETDEKSEAYKSGYKNICDIGKERIRRAGEKIISENPEADIDVGFKVFKVETSNIKEWDTEYSSVESSLNMALSGTLSMFKDGRSPLDIVYELILKERLPLTATITSEDINNSKLFSVNEGMMYIYLGELDDSVVRRIIELNNESFDNNPKVILDESKLTTEMKSNAKKTFDSNGIKDVKTI